MTPEDVVDKTLGWHRIAVQKVREDPDLLRVVEKNIQYFKEGVDIRSRHYFEEWERVFAKGPEHLFAVTLEESDYAANLRQCSPYAGLLTNKERWDYLRQWREKYEAKRS